jgi:NAD(P)H-binding
MLCSVIGADRPERRSGGVREFLAAKHHAEQRLARLEMPCTILRFGRLTDAPGRGRIATVVRRGASLTLSRDDAALALVEGLERPHLAGRAIPILKGDHRVADALDAVPPPPQAVPTDRAVPLGMAQSDNPPDAPDMIAPDAPPLDADVEWEGDGPVPAEPVGNEDPAPGIPWTAAREAPAPRRGPASRAARSYATTLTALAKFVPSGCWRAMCR